MAGPSRKSNLDHAALDRALGSRTPAALTREGRIAQLVEVADALISGRMPNREAARLVGRSLEKWLQEGGDLTKDFFRVVKPKSHRTPSAIFWQQFSETCPHPDEGRDEQGPE